MAALYAGIPNTSPINTVNRQCSSGLTAVNQIANEIRAGQIDIGIGMLSHSFPPERPVTTCCKGAGVESMTKGYGAAVLPEIADEILQNKEAEDCLLPMGITSENVAKDFGISRESQDRFAVSSFQKAAVALKAGKFRAEIVPIQTKIVDPKTEKEVEIVVDADDGIRDGVTYESLAKLKPAFTKDGSTHAGMSVFLVACRASTSMFSCSGNASQVSDGAAAVLLARRSVAKRLGLPILGKYVTGVVAGVSPRIMGVGPAMKR